MKIFERVNRYSYQTVYRFQNNYGASVVIGPFTYGGREGLKELAVIKFESENNSFSLCYDTPITDDVLGYLTEDAVADILKAIESLPPTTERLNNG